MQQTNDLSYHDILGDLVPTNANEKMLLQRTNGQW